MTPEPNKEENLELYKGFGKETDTSPQKRVKHARKHYCFNTNKTYVLLNHGLLAKLKRFFSDTISKNNSNSDRYLEVGQ